MFSHLRLASSCVRSCRRPLHHNFSSTSAARTSLAPDPPSETYTPVNATADPEEGASLAEKASGDVAPKDEQAGQDNTKIETYNEFMAAIGNRFKDADKPRQWLGDNVVEFPFPMNPSFKPPPPVSDGLRTAIYEAFMQDPIKNNVRSLSQRYHLSLKRVDAILRLKGMERAWIKGKTLQTGFRTGMERILGVEPHHHIESHVWTRSDAHQADTLEQEERRDAARQRYQRLYWESVPEDGREPIVPASLEHAKMSAKQFAQAEEDYKSNEKLMPRIKNSSTTRTPRSKIQVATKPGRPTIKFVDVGGKFIEADERLRRIAEAERRATISAQKAATRKTADMGRFRRD